MESFFTICLYVALITGALHTIYWMIVFPVLTLKIKAQVKRCSDEMRLEALRGGMAVRSNDFQILDKFRRMALQICNVPSSSGRQFNKASKPPRELEAMVTRMSETEDAGVSTTFQELSGLMFARHLSAQPMTVLFVAAMVIVSFFSARTTEAIKKRHNEVWSESSDPTSGSGILV